MKITEVKSIHLVYRDPDGQKREWSGGHFDSWSSVLILVITDDGLTGLGEVYQGSCVSQAVPPFVDYFKQWLIGEDPLQIEYLWDKVYNLSAFWNRQGFPIGVLGAIDIALYDLAGKAAKIPTYQLLGGAAHPAMPVYYSAGCTASQEELLRELREAIALGFHAYKWRVVNPEEAGIIMQKMREVAGDEFEIMVDAVQGSSPTPWPKSQVYRVAKALEPFRPAWLEEPFRIENPEAYAELRRTVTYPIAGAESVTSLAEVGRFLAEGSLDIIQPDLTMAGGFTLVKRMAALAQAHHLNIAQHCWGGGVSLMSNLHFGFSQPACICVEHPMYKSPLRDELLGEPLKIMNGQVAPPALPGLGVELTDEVVQKYAATGSEHAGLVFEMN